MPVTPWLAEVSGNWTGESKLHLPWLEDESQRVTTSASVLEIAHDPALTYAVASYTWAYEGEPKSGVLVICGDTASWADSWHQSQNLLNLKAEEGEERVAFRGAYNMGEGPDWGWRIEIVREGQELVLKMTNIHPDENEDWAVEARYSRAV